VRGKVTWCLVAAAVSLAGIRAQNQTGRPYRDIVEAFRLNPDAAVDQILGLPTGIVAQGVADAVSPRSLWPLQTRGAALLIHTDAALYLLGRDRSRAWVHLNHALLLADALPRDPESAWIAH
jgi:hypothetical protein